MPDSDHHFRRITNSEEDVQSQEKKVSEINEDFVWQDELEEETGDKPPVQFSSSDVAICCKKIADYVIGEVSVGTLRDINMGNLCFEISLSRDFHLLLSERFNSVWNLDSRLEMIDKVRSELSSFFDEDIYKSKLNQRIQEVIPDARRSCSLDDIYLNDDMVVMQDDDSPFSVEISLRFDANMEGV